MLFLTGGHRKEVFELEFPVFSFSADEVDVIPGMKEPGSKKTVELK